MMTPYQSVLKKRMGPPIYPFALVDVFAREPFSGNGLSIFLLEHMLPGPVMLRMTQEMRQFETIFLCPAEKANQFRARIFTMEEELPFAGHPLIGAAAYLHSYMFAAQQTIQLEFELSERGVRVSSRRVENGYFAEMEQGPARFGAPLSSLNNEQFANALNLAPNDLADALPLQLVSTGLPYLIVPVKSSIEQARIVAPDFEKLLASVGARFVYVLDVERREGRTWDNAGRVEDIATGSAAGPAGAYLMAHGQVFCGEALVLAQGRFLGRPSEMHVHVSADADANIRVGGQVCLVGEGRLHVPASLFSGAASMEGSGA